MAEIQVLPQTLINQIAAGEVIVRGASVVKELVENSFDAGARHIRVEISLDGRSITVRDDGHGMDEANARRAILRHTTSKIRQLDDLENLSTRGFRGEALASITAVSRFELLTRRADAPAGTRLLAAGGRVERVEAVGVAPGTTIHVRDLFFNTPARLKFLKNPAAEFNAVVEILIQQALSHPETGLGCSRDGKPRFDLPADQSLARRVEELLGSSVQGGLLEVDFDRGEFGVRGFIGRPEIARKDRRWQYLMVNGRPISARQLSFPILEAYQGLLMKQRFPVVVLDIRIDPREVDVNVHPTKEEVRFQEERKIAGLLYRAIGETLDKANLIPTLELPQSENPETQKWDKAREEAEWNRKEESRRPVLSAGETPPSAPGGHAPRFDPSLPFVFSPTGTLSYRPGTEPRLFPRPPERTVDLFPPSKLPRPMGPLSSATAPAPRDDAPETAPVARSLKEGPPPEPLGQLGFSYIVAEWGDDLLLIDQHAAHERLNYSRLKEGDRRSVASQVLLVPIEFELSPADVDIMETALPILREMGVEIEQIAPARFSVGALPADFDRVDVPALARDLIEDTRRESLGRRGLDELRDRVLIGMACHASIKAGQKLGPTEIQRLLDEMIEADLPFTCPHGRPTMILLKKDQLDRQFKRK